MSKPIDLLSAILPAPVKGANFIDPLSSIPQDMSPWLCNVDCENRAVRVRNGYRIHADTADVTVGLSILGMGVWGSGSTAKLLAYCQGGAGNNRVIDCSTTTAANAYTTGSATPDEAQAFNFGGDFAFLHESSTAPTYFDGSVWGAPTLTIGGNPVKLGPSLYYKGRIIHVPNGTGVAYYGDVGQVAGAIDTNPSFNVGEVFAFSNVVAWTAQFSLSDGLVNQDYFAFGNDMGEVLIYSGDYPDHPEWEIAARLKIGIPIAYRTSPTIPYQNDALVLTYDGVVSLRDLFTAGNAQGLRDSTTRAINPYWAALVKDYTGIGSTVNVPSGVYSDRERKVYILCLGFAGEDLSVDLEAATMFVLNTDTGAWSWHKITEVDGSRNGAGILGPGALCYYKGDIYYACRRYVFKLDRTSLLDTNIDSEADLGYTYQIHGAPTSLGETVSKKKVEGYEPIIKQLTPRNPVKLKCSVDMGREETAFVSITNTANVNKRFYSVGEVGTFFQYKIEGVTDAVAAATPGAIELYSTNIAFKKGGFL